MKLFPSRKKDENATEALPPEVKEYYEAGQRERKGVAWLLGLATLLVTVAIGFGAFFGGRWVYRQLANDDKQGPAQVATDQEPAKTDDKPEQRPNPTPSAPSTPQPSTPAPSQPSAPSTPVTGDSSKDLANTGPGETLATFVVVTVAGTFVYQYRLRRRLN